MGHDDSHTCQRCHQPLALDPSITNLTPSAHSLITSALPSPSQPSTLAPHTKLASSPPSSRPSAEIWASSNGIPIPQSGRPVGESFILLSDSIIPPSPPAGPSMSKDQGNGQAPAYVPGLGLSPQGRNLAANLHGILSAKTPISHPLCTECTTMVQLELQKELEELSRDRDAYIEFQRGIVRNRESLGKKGRRKSTAEAAGKDEGVLEGYDVEGTDEEWDELQRRKRELVKEEDRLRKIMAEKEKELEAARKEEARVKQEEEQMDKDEEDFLLSHAELSTELRKLDETLSSAQTNLLLSQSLLSHLESANVYNDAFQIGHVPLDASTAGRGGISVGTINGLRLGGRPIVEWDEINAGWGLVALCVDRIAAKVGCVFETYKILPLGSFSRIEEIPASKGSYELYASSDLSPARLLQNRRFNHALVSLLELLRQLVDYGRANNRGWGVDNIEIRKDKISGHSIRLPGLSAMQMPTLSSMSIMGLGSSQSTADKDRDGNRKDADSSGEEQWTRACRAVLAVLKRILVVESEADRTAVTAAASTSAMA